MHDRSTATPDKPADSAGTPMFLRISLVMSLTGLGRSTIYRLMAEDAFPQPVRLTRRRIAWRRADLDQWSDGRQKVAH